MLRFSASVCINAPAARVWAALARLEDLELWSEPVLSARCEPGHECGVGALRICRLKGGVSLHERWTAWDEGRSFTYEGSGIPLVQLARNTWEIEAHGDQTLLMSHAEVRLRGGILGRLLEPLMAWWSRRLARRSLAAFSHLVEHGVVPPVKHARLPRPAAAC